MLCSLPLLILLGLGAALIGGIIGWMIRGPKFATLEEDLDRRNRQIKKLSADYESLNSKNQYLQRQLRELEATHHEVNSTLSKWKSDHSEIEKINANIRMDYEEMKIEYSRQVNELTQSHTSLRNDYEKLRLILEEKDRNLLLLQRELDQQKSEEANQNKFASVQLSSIKASYEALLAEHRDYAKMIDQLKAENKELESTIDAFKNDSDGQMQLSGQQVAELKTYNLALAQDKEAATATINLLENRIEDLEKALLETNTDWESKYQNLINQYKIAQSTIEDLESERTNAYERFSLLDGEYGNSITEWGKKNDELKTELDLAKQKIQDLETSQSDFDPHLIEVEKLKFDQTIAEWEAKYTNLLHQYMDERSNLSNSDAQKEDLVKEMEAKIKRIEYELVHANHQIEVLHTENQTVEEEWKEKYEILLQDLTKARTLVGNIDTEKTHITDQMLSLKDQHYQVVADWESKYHHLLHQFNTLKDQFDALAHSHGETVNKLEFVDGQRNQVLADWETKYHNLLDQFNLANHKIGLLEAEKEATDGRFQSLIQEITDLEDRYSDAQQQLEKLESDRHNYHEEWEHTFIDINEKHRTALSRVEELEQSKNLILQRFQEIESEKDNDLNEWKKKYGQLESLYHQLMENMQSLEEDKNQVFLRMQHSGKEHSETLTAWEARYDELLEKYNRLNEQLADFQEERGMMSIRLDQSEMEKLDALAAWEARYGELLAQFENSKGQLNDLENERSLVTLRMRELENSNYEATGMWEAKYNHLLEQFNALTQTVNDLEHLKGQLVMKIQQMEQDKVDFSNQWNAQLESLRSDKFQSESDYKNLFDNYSALALEYDAYKGNIDSEFSGLQNKLNELNSKFDVLRSENIALKNELSQHREFADQYKVQLNELQASRDKLQSDMETLQARYIAELDEIVYDADSYKSKFESLLQAQKNTSIIIAELEKERDQLSSDYQKLNSLYLNLSREEGTFKDKYEALISRQRNYESIISDLESQLGKYREGQRLLRSTFSLEPEEAILERISSNSSKINIQRIGTASEENKDDLERIKGIGSFTVKKLNALGIFTFRQLANLTPDDVAVINEALEYFPGRIQREEWVSQSKIILGMVDTDDLKVIEGIEAPVETILRQNGIQTWNQLASAQIDFIKQLLEQNGNDFRHHDPSTWPAQAQLAAQGKWDELSRWQSELKGGFDI